jgi:hypothetical protein
MYEFDKKQENRKHTLVPDYSDMEEFQPGSDSDSDLSESSNQLNANIVDFEHNFQKMAIIQSEESNVSHAGQAIESRNHLEMYGYDLNNENFSYVITSK